MKRYWRSSAWIHSKASQFAASGKYDAIVRPAAGPGVCRLTRSNPRAHSRRHTLARMWLQLSGKVQHPHVVAPTTLSIKHAVERYGFGHNWPAHALSTAGRRTSTVYQGPQKAERARLTKVTVIIEEIPGVHFSREQDLRTVCSSVRAYQAFEDE